VEGEVDGDDMDDTVQRVALLEASVLFQSEELQRAKASFLNTNNEIRLQLAEAQQEVCRLQNLLITPKEQSNRPSTSPSTSLQSPKCGYTTEVPSILASHIKRISDYRSLETKETNLRGCEPKVDNKVDRISRIPRRIQFPSKTKSITASQIDISGVQDKLSELVELLSTPKYEDIKLLLTQLNIVSSLHRNTSLAPVVETEDDGCLVGDETSPDDVEEDQSPEKEHVAISRELFTCEDDHNNGEDDALLALKDSIYNQEEQNAEADMILNSNYSQPAIGMPVASDASPFNYMHTEIIDSTTTRNEHIIDVHSSENHPPNNYEEHEIVEKVIDHENLPTVITVDYNTQQDTTANTSGKRRKSSLVTHKERDRSHSRSSMRPQEHQQHQQSQKLSKPFKYLWKAYVDAASGETYYHNKRDGVTTWDRPPDEDLRLVIMPDGSLAADDLLALL